MPPRLGLRANLPQFTLLVAVNAFVGAMVGQERALVPLLAERSFGVSARTAALAFIMAFGLTKALANLGAGVFAERWGRKRLLVLGWLLGLPVPIMLIAAPAWSWVVAANALLGINQGLCWSTTIIMKVDLVGPGRRGLAMGLNEFAGYGAVSLAALASGFLAAATGTLRPVPLYPGVAFAAVGLLLSWSLVEDTTAHARLETSQLPHAGTLPFARVLLMTSWKDRSLFAASQAGLVNNLNDGMVWGLVPILLAARGLPMAKVALVAATYPGVWGVAQLATGALSDAWGRRRLIVGGMWVQAVGIGLVAASSSFRAAMAGAVLLGLGTALVYPTLLAVVADVARPSWRAAAIGVYRLWRDGGYVIGALTAGVLSDLFGMAAAVGAVGVLTFGSGILAMSMRETSPGRLEDVSAEGDPWPAAAPR